MRGVIPGVISTFSQIADALKLKRGDYLVFHVADGKIILDKLK